MKAYCKTYLSALANGHAVLLGCGEPVAAGAPCGRCGGATAAEPQDNGILLVGNYSIGWDDWCVSWGDAGEPSAMKDGADMPLAKAFQALTAYQQRTREPEPELDPTGWARHVAALCATRGLVVSLAQLEKVCGIARLTVGQAADLITVFVRGHTCTVTDEHGNVHEGPSQL